MDKKTRMIGILGQMAGGAMALDMLRMTVNRPGVINGIDWQKWWQHGSWKELNRLNKELEKLLNADPELRCLYEDAIDSEL